MQRCSCLLRVAAAVGVITPGDNASHSFISSCNDDDNKLYLEQYMGVPGFFHAEYLVNLELEVVCDIHFGLLWYKGLDKWY